MKRSTGEMENVTSMAKCLMLLSRKGDSDQEFLNPSTKTAVLGRVFECKTCNRKFSSFQALGGHRASHKKPKLMEGEMQNQSQLQTAISQAIKPKTHECSICGLEFSIGQALGGHMRRHRATLSGDHHQVLSTITSSSSSSGHHHQQVPVLQRSTSRRVLCLDLNLTPLENDLELPIGTGFPEKNTRPPMIYCFI